MFPRMRLNHGLHQTATIALCLFVSATSGAAGQQATGNIDPTIRLRTAPVTSGPLASIDWTEYRRVPGGIFHQSCIHHVPAFSTVDDRTGDVHNNNGTAIAHYDHCNYPSFPRHKSGEQSSTSTTEVVPFTNAWVDGASQLVPSNPFGQWNYTLDYMTVPPAGFPCSGGQCYIPTGGETIFLWSGLLTGNGAEVIQNVVQWGPGADLGGPADYWSYASWAVGATGVYYSDPLYTYEGDTIGMASYISQTNPLRWFIVMIDETQNQATGFYFGSGGDDNTSYPSTNTFPIAFPAVFEGWNVNSCSELPSYPYNQATFTNIALYMPGSGGLLSYQEVQANEAPFANNVSPNCSFGASVTISGETASATLTF